MGIGQSPSQEDFFVHLKLYLERVKNIERGNKKSSNILYSSYKHKKNMGLANLGNAKLQLHDHRA